MNFTDQNGPKGVEHVKINFDHFQIQEMLQKVRAEKVDEKMRLFL